MSFPPSSANAASSSQHSRKSKYGIVVFLVLITCALGIFGWRQSSSARVQQHIGAGSTLLAQGKTIAAQNEWREAVRLEPQSAAAWLLLGESFLRSDQWRSALDALQRVEKIDANTPNLYARLALCALQISDLEAARRYAETELKRNPNHIEALQVLVTVSGRGADNQKRLDALRRLVQAEPNNTEFLAKLADAHIAQGQYSDALPLLERLLKLDPNFNIAYAMRGLALFKTDSSPSGLQRAQRDFQKALQLNPQDMNSRLSLARVYLSLRQPDKAIPHLEIVGRAPTSDLSYLFELAKAYQQMGQLANASALRNQYAALQAQERKINILRSLVANNSQDFDANLQLGSILLKHRQPLNAEKHLMAAAKLRPTDLRPQAALQQLENRYLSQLNAVEQSLKKKDMITVSQHIGLVMMLRPKDQRTTRIVQRVVAAAQTSDSASVRNKTLIQ